MVASASARSTARLFDRDSGALRRVLRQMVNSSVQHTPHPLQHFEASVAEMLARVLRPNVIYECLDLWRGYVTEEATVGILVRRALLFVHITFLSTQASFISTVNILFCNEARVGVSAAMDVGSPIWRRSVPICTTSSSPFLNKPISPFTATVSRSRTS